jgi:hypothetical protein
MRNSIFPFRKKAFFLSRSFQIHETRVKSLIIFYDLTINKIYSIIKNQSFNEVFLKLSSFHFSGLLLRLDGRYL